MKMRQGGCMRTGRLCEKCLLAPLISNLVTILTCYSKRRMAALSVGQGGQ